MSIRRTASFIKRVEIKGDINAGIKAATDITD